MEKKKIVSILKVVLKVLIPLVIGWVEGDTAMMASTISSLF